MNKSNSSLPWLWQQPSPYGMTECDNGYNDIETGSLWEHMIAGIIRLDIMLHQHIMHTHNRFYFIAFGLCCIIVWLLAYITDGSTSVHMLPAVAGIQ